MTLPPPFLANQPLDRWLREGVEAERCTRCTLGRTLAEVSTSGGEGLWSARALAVCRHEGLDGRGNPLDTTRVSLRGADGPEPGVEAMHMTHGSSKDHRPDVTQASGALLVSQDGGVPLVRTRWEGQTAETPRFPERAPALITALQPAPTPRDVVADAPRDDTDHAAHLQACGVITRLPRTRKLVTQGSCQALTWDQWRRGEATTR